jgi:hypothetical protein
MFVCVYGEEEKISCLVGCLPHSLIPDHPPPPPHYLLTLVYSCLLLIWIFWEYSCSWKVQLLALAGVSRAEQLTSQIEICTILRVLLVFTLEGSLSDPSADPLSTNLPTLVLTSLFISRIYLSPLFYLSPFSFKCK